MPFVSYVLFMEKIVVVEKIGGQAVIEGVMMISRRKLAIAVRRGKKIIIKTEPIRKKPRILEIFFVRGIVNIADMLVKGIRALNWSAEKATKEEKLTVFEVFISIFLAFVFAIALFIVAPFFLTKVLVSDRGILFNLVDGIIRVLIFLAYVFIISRLKDIQKIFQYHGAEHKVVNCYENGKKLTTENIKKFTTLHPRCGTSFLMIVLIVSIIVFSMIIDERWHIKIIGRVVLIPVIAGLSYEFLKLGDRFRNSRFMKALIMPGLLLQRMTTREPDEKQIEVAMVAFKGAAG